MQSPQQDPCRYISSKLPVPTPRQPQERDQSQQETTARPVMGVSWLAKAGATGATYEPIPCGPPHGEDVQPQKLNFGDTPSQTEEACHICGE